MDNENNLNYNTQPDPAKGKIILFVIGTLLGAVIASAAFLICVNTLGANNNNSAQSSQQMPSGTPPEMPSGENSQSTPPEKPSDNNSQTNN